MSVGVADRLGRIELRGDPSSLGVPRAVRDKLAALMTGCVQRDLERFFIDLLGGEATCSEGFVMCFLKVPLACLGSRAAAVQPSGCCKVSLVPKYLTKDTFQSIFPNPGHMSCECDIRL